MKCIHYILLSLFSLAPATVLAEDLWEMKELSVLAFDSRDVTIEADEDHHGVQSLNSIRRYIEGNPARWVEDQFHPAAAPNPFNRWLADQAASRPR